MTEAEKDTLERIAIALESIADYRLHTCGTCDGVGEVISNYNRKDAMGLDRDFSGLDVVPHLIPKFEFDYVQVREQCLICSGTGKLPTRNRVSSVWSREGSR